MIYARVNRTIDTQAASAQTAGCFFFERHDMCRALFGTRRSGASPAHGLGAAINLLLTFLVIMWVGSR